MSVKSFELLFDRPNEPLITPKGEDNSLFQLTEELLVSYEFLIINLVKTHQIEAF